MEIYEVRYPDERDREEGYSTVLFRDRTLADRFARRLHGWITVKWVSLSEFHSMARQHMFENGANNARDGHD